MFILLVAYIICLCHDVFACDICLHKGCCYTQICTAPIENETVVWPRVVNGSSSDSSALFVGYSNKKTRYGDEGVDVLATTPKCSRTVFFSGGPDGLPAILQSEKDSYEFVDRNKYNHLYGDFRALRTQFPYLVNSAFFDYIFVGKDTFMYFSTAQIIIDFCSMLKTGGCCIIAAGYYGGSGAYKGPRFNTFLGENFSIVPYFDPNHFEMNRLFHLQYTLGRYDPQINSVEALKAQVCEKIPFVENFLEQSTQGTSSVVLMITKND